MVLLTSTVDSPATLGIFAKEPAIRSMISWDAARRTSRCLSWLIHVSCRYIRKEFPIQQIRAMMNSGDIPASSSRT